MDLLKVQWEHLLKYVQTGTIDGYTILGAYQIDEALEGARWAPGLHSRKLKLSLGCFLNISNLG